MPPGEHRWVLLAARGDERIAEEAFAVAPDAPFRTRIALPAGSDDGQVVITVEDSATRRVILLYVV